MSLGIWVAEFIGMTKPGEHFRVEPGQLRLQGRPKTIYRQTENFNHVLDYFATIKWFSLYHAHFWLLLFCTTFYWADQNNYPYCYDNVWADIVLENGRPNKDSIYSIVDLFTWEGWLWVLTFYFTFIFIKKIA